MIKTLANLSIVLMVLGMSSGCASLNLGSLTEGGAFGSKPQPKPTAAPGGPTVSIEFHRPDASDVKTVSLPLEQGMTVQDAIDKTKAGKHFRRMSIDVMRTHAQSGEPHKMQISFDNAKDRVAFSTNYSLYANDRIMVTENTDTIVDDLLSSFLGRTKQPNRR